MPLPPAVYLVCLDGTHPTKQVRIDVLTRENDGTWHTHESTKTRRGKEIRRRTMTYLTGDDVTESQTVMYGEGRPFPPALGARRSFTFRCKLCGTAVHSRGERLDRILDQLTEAADT